MSDFRPLLIERKPMKGFIHILEIMIVALVIFLVMALFAYIPRIETDWARTRLILYGNDLFFSLDSKGVDWLNKTQVNDSISRLLPGNLKFDLSVKNAVKPQISLGCACPQGMVNVFDEFLNDLEFNGVNTSFRLEWINSSDISFPITLDLVLFLDMNIPDSKRNELEQYLDHDKGVIEISSLDANIIGYPIQRDILNLGYVQAGVQTNADAGFQETMPGRDNYKIRKYFSHLPFRIGLAPGTAPQGVTSCTNRYVSGLFTFRENSYRLWVTDNTTTIPGSCDLALYIDMNGNSQLEPGEGPFMPGEGFELGGYSFLPREIKWDHTDIIFQEGPGYEFVFSGLGETVYPRDNASEKVLLRRADELYGDGRGIPVSAINYYIINGKGRAAWLSNSSVHELKSDTKQLIKSLIIWAAGEEYRILERGDKTSPVTLYFYKFLSRDMFQPIEISLTLGYMQ